MSEQSQTPNPQPPEPEPTEPSNPAPQAPPTPPTDAPPPAPTEPAPRVIDPELLRRTGRGFARALSSRCETVGEAHALEQAWALVKDEKKIPNEAIDATIGASIPEWWVTTDALSALAELEPRGRRLVLAFAAAFYHQGSADSKAAQK